MQTGLIFLFSFVVCVKIRLVFLSSLCVCLGGRLQRRGGGPGRMGVAGVHAAQLPSNQ